MDLLDRPLRGAKKGGSSSSGTTEAPDSLFSTSYAKVLELISTGEIAGFCDQDWNLVTGEEVAKAIYLDGTPVMNSDGTLNFENVSIDTRLGTVDQTYIAGFPSVENETSVGVELTSDTPWVRAISNSDLSAVRITLAVSGLSKVNSSSNKIDGYSISYAIDVATDGGAYSTVLTNAFTGKTTSTYQRSHRIELPEGASWQIRVRRMTANANSSTIADTTSVVSYTEIIDAKLRYPMSALLALIFGAAQFSSIPERASRVKLQIVRVPANYDPDTRTYATSGTGTSGGVWDGTFKRAWSNNPAWVFYDMVLNDVYGLGNLVDASMVDKWNLYQIAQYCDVLVSDGKGGHEPRFTCDVYLQSRNNAYQVLSDLASVFRGISYYANGQVYARADMPRDPVYTYSPANVVDGRFTYTGSARTARYTAALVSWVNLDNMAAVEQTYVEYPDGIARYGYRQKEISAFGCTSESMAQRVGMHVILSDCLEPGTVQFQVGLDSLKCVPGDVILIADPNRAGRRTGGRVSSATADIVTLDKADGIAAGATLYCKLPSGALQGRTVQSVTGNAVTVAVAFDEVPATQAVWAVSSADLALQSFQVLSIAEDDDAITYTITAMQYEPQKFAAIDNGAAIDTKPITVIPSASQQPPTDIAITGNAVIVQGIATNVMDISWTAPAGAVAYEVQWRKDDGNWVTAGQVGTTSVEVTGVYTGSYVARVRAINASNVKSIWATSAAADVEGKTGAPPALASLSTTSEIFGIKLDWAFQAGSSDTSYTEIYYSPTNSFSAAQLLGQFSYPTNTHRLQGLAAGVQFFFWGRLVDKSGNISAWYPDEAGAGVVGASSTNADEILDYLVAQITEAQLGTDLLAKVNSIDDLVPLLWDADAIYSKGQTAVYDGVIYSWTSDTDGNETPPGTNWQDVGTAIVDAGAIVGQVNQNTSDISTLDGQVTAQGEQISGIFAQVNTHGAGDTTWGAGDTDVYAGTITIQSVLANGDLAQATRIDIVQASLDETNATVEETSTALATLDGKASASYVVKTAVTSDGQYYAAGIALGIDASGGTVQSSFLVYADLFGVLNSTGSGATVTSPFTISGGQVFIRSAVIQDGSITNAKVGDLQSTATGAGGLPLWSLSKAGALTMTGADAGSGYMKITSNLLQVFDNSGVTRIKLGIW